MIRTNDLRARDAERCLNLLASLTGKDDREGHTTDLIASVGHYCDRHGLDFLQLIVIGVGHWKLEQTDPEAGGVPPHVTITIDGEEHQRKIKNYRATIRETRTFVTEVEAPDDEAAEEIATELYYGWSVDEINQHLETAGHSGSIEVEIEEAVQ